MKARKILPFVPPGVQCQINDRFGRMPLVTKYTDAKIQDLWKRRNSTAEQDLDYIDQQMFELVVKDRETFVRMSERFQ